MNITNAPITGISETKLDQNVFSRELQVDAYDLENSIRQGEVVMLPVTLINFDCIYLQRQFLQQHRKYFC